MMVRTMTVGMPTAHTSTSRMKKRTVGTTSEPADDASTTS